MALKPFPRFKSFPTHHCVTGSMRHVYQLLGTDVTEELLLGLGAGVGFVYWQQKGLPPFLGGRANTTSRDDKAGFEALAARRTGVAVTHRTTGGARKAHTALLAELTAGVPAMLQVDMGLLPYFDFGTDYHFGGHVIVVVGYDETDDIVLVCDRDEQLHPVSLDALEAARASTFQPFPPRHGSWRFDFTGQRPPRPDEVRAAISETATAMVEPPIRNLGVAGIRKAATLVPRWPSTLEPHTLAGACRNGFIMIDATGGTGGGLFRYMYARFLHEAAAITGDDQLRTTAAQFQDAGDRWQQVAGLFDQASHENDPGPSLSAITPLLTDIAEIEDTAWRQLAAASNSPST